MLSFLFYLDSKKSYIAVAIEYFFWVKIGTKETFYIQFLDSGLVLLGL